MNMTAKDAINSGVKEEPLRAVAIAAVIVVKKEVEVVKIGRRGHVVVAPVPTIGTIEVELVPAVVIHQLEEKGHQANVLDQIGL